MTLSSTNWFCSIATPFLLVTSRNISYKIIGNKLLYPLKTLTITPAHYILSVTDLNNLTWFIPDHFLKFFSEDVRRFSGFLTPSSSFLYNQLYKLLLLICNHVAEVTQFPFLIYDLFTHLIALHLKIVHALTPYNSKAQKICSISTL